MGIVFAVFLIGLPSAAFAWAMWREDKNDVIGRFISRRREMLAHASATRTSGPAPVAHEVQAEARQA